MNGSGEDVEEAGEGEGPEQAAEGCGKEERRELWQGEVIGAVESDGTGLGAGDFCCALHL
jgi:hypothetical protein